MATTERRVWGMGEEGGAGNTRREYYTEDFAQLGVQISFFVILNWQEPDTNL